MAMTDEGGAAMSAATLVKTHWVTRECATAGCGALGSAAPSRFWPTPTHCVGASADTVALLQGLLRQAIAGELAGLVVIGLLPPGKAGGKKYDVNLSGLAAANTTLAVGAMDVCQMLLREAALEESGLA